MFSSVIFLALVTYTTPGMVSGQTCSTVTTFNAGLTPRIPNYSSRKTEVPKALVAEDSDVICLQEYWFEADMDTLLQKVKSTYPYHYSALHSSISSYSRKWRFIPKAPCSHSDLLHFVLRVLPCGVLNGCLTSSLEGILACAASKCKTVLKHPKFNPNCFSCISTTAVSFDKLLDACKPGYGAKDNRFNNAGLVILSKKKITKATYSDFFPGKRMTIRRGYIEAEIEDIGTVVCSHLSAIFGLYYEYDLPYSSYEEQNQAEVGIIDDKYGSVDHTFAADFNTGPIVSNADPQKNLVGEAPDNFQLLLDKGYSTTYMSDDGKCTYCAQDINPLTFSESSNAIDFIMTMGSGLTNSNSQRTLDSSPPLSDHYGVKATVCKN